MKERLHQPFGNGDKPAPAEPDRRVCVYCANRTSDACEGCFSEGKYRRLAPEPLSHWEELPRLPSFKELLEMPASERLALVYLALHYLTDQVDGK